MLQPLSGSAVRALPITLADTLLASGPDVTPLPRYIYTCTRTLVLID